ncbi:hypothetical protein GW17_00023402 [Ensete ventricosum]|uniref:Uncharacterized protein n=1 Tax=Ensete ventricosum TaxID=4639 RepID=A0A444ER89_ENSVE|nr:hypothetical protein GW17_00023402 [Ensete ventricosum]RZR70783.1 hypothetical protein BHM03_00001505 [Ensete ventricosum]
MEVRVKIKYTSLCHTDVYFWEAKACLLPLPRYLIILCTDSTVIPWMANFPATAPCYMLCSSMNRIVESVGEGVTDVEVGDHVLPVFTGECKECAHCKSQESNMCNLLRINTDRGVMISDGNARFSKNGNPIYHFLGTSTFSEYTVVHVGCLAKIDKSAPLDKVCVLSCGISTGIIYTLPNFEIRNIMFHPFYPQGSELHSMLPSLKKVIAEMTNGGVDRSVECTGNVKAMMSAFECVHDVRDKTATCLVTTLEGRTAILNFFWLIHGCQGWGVAVLVGVPNKDDMFMTKPVNLLNERTLRGTFFGNYKPRTDLPSVIDMYMKKQLEVEKFITHRVPFSDINKAFDYMLKGESLRCLISMDE